MGSRFEESILRSMRRMSRAVDLHSKRLSTCYQLTGPQLVCLRQIHRAGVTTPTKLAREVSLSQATVSGIVERLQARGLVTKRRSDEDKRRSLLELTAEGRDAVVSAPSPLQDEFGRRLALLPEGEQAMIDWVLRRVVNMMEAEHIDAAPMLSTGPILAQHENVADFLGEPVRFGEEAPGDPDTAARAGAPAPRAREDDDD